MKIKDALINICSPGRNYANLIIETEDGVADQAITGGVLKIHKLFFI